MLKSYTELVRYIGMHTDEIFHESITNMLEKFIEKKTEPYLNMENIPNQKMRNNHNTVIHQYNNLKRKREEQPVHVEEPPKKKYKTIDN